MFDHINIISLIFGILLFIIASKKNKWKTNFYNATTYIYTLGFVFLVRTLISTFEAFYLSLFNKEFLKDCEPYSESVFYGALILLIFEIIPLLVIVGVIDYKKFSINYNNE